MSGTKKTDGFTPDYVPLAQDYSGFVNWMRGLRLVVCVESDLGNPHQWVHWSSIVPTIE